MSTNSKSSANAAKVPTSSGAPTSPTLSHTFEWEEVARSLFVTRGLSNGLFHLGVGLKFAGLTAQWGEAVGNSAPTAMIGVAHLALTPATVPGPMTFDAGELTSSAAKGRAAKPAKRRR